MPQLNPAPWFIIFLFVWLALMLYSTKIVKLQQPEMLPTPGTPDKTSANWQWL